VSGRREALGKGEWKRLRTRAHITPLRGSQPPLAEHAPTAWTCAVRCKREPATDRDQSVSVFEPNQRSQGSTPHFYSRRKCTTAGLGAREAAHQ